MSSTINYYESSYNCLDQLRNSQNTEIMKAIQETQYEQQRMKN